MTPTLLTKMVGLTTSAQIWKKLKIYYATQSRAKIKKLKLQLKTPKHDRSVAVYVLDVKRVTYALAAIGAPISEEYHIEAILDLLTLVTLPGHNGLHK